MTDAMDKILVTERENVKPTAAGADDTKEFLHQVLDALPAAIYTTDKDGRVTYFNPAAVALSGRQPQLGSDQWCVSWKLFYPDGTPMAHDECPMAIALKEGKSLQGTEVMAERPDGTRVPFLPFPTPLRDDDGNVVGAVNMLLDISDRKSAEVRQRTLFDELNHRVKNNMQMLHALLRIAERENQSSEARVALSEAGQQVAAMGAAQKLLYSARSSSGFEATDFLEAVCSVVSNAFSRKIRVIREIASAHLHNDAAVPLALIMNELLTNAAEHGCSGADPEIRVGLFNHGPHFELYVEDDGPGFDLVPATRHLSGLGLVSGLSRQLGGTFDVERTSGTRCVLRFPSTEDR